MDLAPVVDESILYDHTVGKEEGESGAFVKKGEYLKFLSEFSMVTFFSFLEHVEIFLKIGRLRIGCSVNTGKHFVFLVSSPVRSGNAHKFERLDGLCAHKVRAGAEIRKVSLLVE